DVARLLTRSLESALANLGSDERLAFHAHFVEGRTIEEVARLLGAHRATVGRRLKKARTKILREVSSQLRIGIGVGPRELRGASPELAKEVDVDWAQLLRDENERPRESS